jgi:hypothetical protein
VYCERVIGSILFEQSAVDEISNRCMQRLP